MAENKPKTQAEKAAQAKRQNKSGNGKTASPKGKNTVKQEEGQVQIPTRLITSAVALGVFILFLVAFLWPEGWFVELFLSFVTGLIGLISFYVAIPALAYLFVIQAFSGKRPVKMRSICLIVFVLLCGCISQLMLGTNGLPEGASILAALYQGGMTGSTG